MVLRLEGERVHVDTYRGGAGVVLVGLHVVEVRAEALVKAIVAVQLDLADRSGVIALGITIVEGLVVLVVAVHEAVELRDPHKLLHGVVKGHLDIVRRRGHRLGTRELELLNQILMGHLGEAATLLRVEVDVVRPERSRNETRLVHHGVDGLGIRISTTTNVAQQVEGSELDVDLHLVVLEGNQRECEARVAAEPELQRNIQRVLRDALHTTA